MSDLEFISSHELPINCIVNLGIEWGFSVNDQYGNVLHHVSDFPNEEAFKQETSGHPHAQDNFFIAQPLAGYEGDEDGEGKPIRTHFRITVCDQNGDLLDNPTSLDVMHRTMSGRMIPVVATP